MTQTATVTAEHTPTASKPYTGNASCASHVITYSMVRVSRVRVSRVQVVCRARAYAKVTIISYRTWSSVWVRVRVGVRVRIRGVELGSG